MQNDKQNFPMRSMTKAELALMCHPNVKPELASQKLRRRMYQDSELMKDLEQTFYQKYAHRLTPRQVRMIFNRLGTP